MSFDSASLRMPSNFLIPNGFFFGTSFTFIGSLAKGEKLVNSFLFPNSEAIDACSKAFLIPVSLRSLVVVIPTKFSLFQTLNVMTCFCDAFNCFAFPLST